jgi:hypothetical protein
MVILSSRGSHLQESDLATLEMEEPGAAPCGITSNTRRGARVFEVSEVSNAAEKDKLLF